MARFSVAACLTAICVFSPSGLALADRQLAQDNADPVVAQLAFRDRTVTVTSNPQGYIYSVADDAGTVLSATLTAAEMADRYPELFELLQPAVADHGTVLMMLAPLAD